MSIHKRADSHDRSNSKAPATPRIYPAYAFPAAPTYLKWVKLTAADIHALRWEQAFEGQNIYFHLNHPIEFVYIIGPVVAIDHFVTKYNTRFSTLEIDDGSGATLEVKISYKQPPAPRPAQATYNLNQPGPTKQQQRHRTTSSSDGEDNSSGTDSDTSTRSHTKGTSNSTPKDTQPTPTLTTRTFETTVQNLTVLATPTSTDLVLNTTKITIGTVLKAKGTLQRWRDTFQLSLRRVFPVSSVDEEVAYWTSYADFAHRVLCKPWELSDGEVDRLERQTRREAEETRQRAAQKREKEQQRVAKRRRWEEKRERYERRVEDRLARRAVAQGLDGNALDRVDWRPAVSAVVTGEERRGCVPRERSIEHAQGDGRRRDLDGTALWQHEWEHLRGN